MKTSLERKWQRYVAAVLMIAVLVALPMQGPAQAEDNQDPALGRFLTVYELVKQYYVMDVDPAKLMTGAIRGMLATLDPWSVYFDPREFQDFNDQLEGKFGGIGIRPDKVGDYIVVAEVLPGNPAEAAGVKQGDLILSVDGKNVVGLELADVLPLIRGEPGTPVKLTLQRDKQTLDVTVVRGEIREESIKAQPMGDGIFYDQLYNFNQDAGKNLAAVVGVQRSQGARGIILDLRGNPGGYLGEAVTAAEAFIGSGPVVRLLDRKGTQDVIESSSGVKPIPVVILVDGGTASAAEVLAGALQDSGMATLVGTHTFGKGLVQTIVPLDNGIAVKLTTMKYQTPKGRDILPEKGLTPEVAVDLPSLPPAPIVYKRPLKSGLVGLDVLALQQRLAGFGYKVGEPDGVYGGQTAAAVRTFQKAWSLPATGVADEATVKAVNQATVAEHIKDVQLDKALEVLKSKLQ